MPNAEREQVIELLACEYGLTIQPELLELDQNVGALVDSSLEVDDQSASRESRDSKAFNDGVLTALVLDIDIDQIVAGLGYWVCVNQSINQVHRTNICIIRELDTTR